MKEQDKIDCIMLALMMMFLYGIAMRINDDTLLILDIILLLITYFAFIGKVRK
jgi:hypothetical protein